MILGEESEVVDSIDRHWLTLYVSRKDQSAFASLVERHERLVRGACRRVLRDPHLAEDALQSTFLVLAVRADELLRREGSVAGWLHTVATNAARQLQRTRTRSQRRDSQVSIETHDSPLNELLGMLDEELQHLDGSSRDAIVLCHLQGRTQEEAASELGISRATLRRRMDHGLETLKDKFRRRGLIVPLLAVLWNALDAQSCPASEPSQRNELAEAASRVVSGSRIRPFSSTVSNTSWQLTQGILAMSRWNTIRRWCLVSCTVLGVGFWGFRQADSTTEAAEPSTEQVKKNPDIGRTPEKAPPAPSQKPEGQPLSIAPGIAAMRKLKPALPPEPAADAKAPEKEAQADLLNKLKNVKKKATEPKGFLPVNPLPPQGIQQSSFQGVININGKEIRTNDPQEFQKLMKQQGNLFNNFPLMGNFPPDLGKNLPGANNRDDMLGKPLEITGQSIEGQDFDLRSLQGKVVLVNFWATWCGPCRAEFPHLQKQYQRYHDKGFEIVGVSLDHDRQELKNFLEQENVPWITLFKEDQGQGNPNAKRYGIGAIPTCFLIDQKGNVVSTSCHGEELEQQLEKLLGPAQDPDAKPALKN